MSGDHSDDKPPATDMEERHREQWERYRHFKEVTPAETQKKKKASRKG